MSRRVRSRQQRSIAYYRVIRPGGIPTVVSAGRFIANVAAGILIRDKNDRRLARVRKWLDFRVDEASGELIFKSTRRQKTSPVAQTSTGALLRDWLRSNPNLSAAQARQKMLLSLPRILTEAVCLY
jgi:hypothetical protein